MNKKHKSVQIRTLKYWVESFAIEDFLLFCLCKTVKAPWTLEFEET